MLPLVENFLSFFNLSLRGWVGHKVPVILDMLHKLLELSGLNSEEHSQGSNEQQERVNPSLQCDQHCGGADDGRGQSVG